MAMPSLEAADCRLFSAVKRSHVSYGLEFTCGVGTFLDTKLWVLRDWWKDVALPAV